MSDCDAEKREGVGSLHEEENASYFRENRVRLLRRLGIGAEHERILVRARKKIGRAPRVIRLVELIDDASAEVKQGERAYVLMEDAQQQNTQASQSEALGDRDDAVGLRCAERSLLRVVTNETERPAQRSARTPAAAHDSFASAARTGTGT